MRDEETARSVIDAYMDETGGLPAYPEHLARHIAAALADARRAERERIARAIRDDWRVQHTISVDELVELVCALE